MAPNRGSIQGIISGIALRGCLDIKIISIIKIDIYRELFKIARTDKKNKIAVVKRNILLTT